MALTLRDFLRDLGDQLIRIDDEIDPVTQAAGLCAAAPRPILLERLRGFPGWKLNDILLKDRAREALALGVSSPQNVVRELSDRMFSRVPGQTKLVSDGPCKEVRLVGNAADITRPVSTALCLELQRREAGALTAGKRRTRWRRAG